MNFEYLIISGGKLPPFSFVKKLSNISTHVVAVDRGAVMLNKLKRTAELFVGDGDSLPPQITFRARKSIMLPTVKDLSDLEVALDLLPKSASKIIIGAHTEFENRSDHLFVNLMLALDNQNSYFADEHGWVTGLHNSQVRFHCRPASLFSVVSPSKFRMTVSGAKFATKNMVIKHPSHGLSNHTVPGKSCALRVKGKALLFVSRSILNCKIKL